jgi:hypothetical protein
MPDDGNIRVATRTRPLHPSEMHASSNIMVVGDSGDSITAVNPSNLPATGAAAALAQMVSSEGVDISDWARTFQFDRCYTGSPHGDSSGTKGGSTQLEIFRDVGLAHVKHLCRGCDSTLMLYGQSGSGKSHTLMGSLSSLTTEATAKDDIQSASSDAGLIPRVCYQIFARARRNEFGKDAELEMTYYELHHDGLRDLLSEHPQRLQPLKLREDPEDGTCVSGLTRKTIKPERDSWSEVHGVLQKRQQSQDGEGHPGRPHAIFLLTLIQKSKGLKAKLAAIDLAGSERLKASETHKTEVLKETVSINKCLAALGDVICALSQEESERKKTGDSGFSVSKEKYIPFRNSSLTRILKDTLKSSGSSRTTMIATLSPCSIHFVESMATLRFAKRVRRALSVSLPKQGPRCNKSLELNTSNPPSPCGTTSSESSKVVDEREVALTDTVVRQMHECMTPQQMLSKTVGDPRQRLQRLSNMSASKAAPPRGSGDNDSGYPSWVADFGLAREKTRGKKMYRSESNPSIGYRTPTKRQSLTLGEDSQDYDDAHFLAYLEDTPQQFKPAEILSASTPYSREVVGDPHASPVSALLEPMAALKAKHELLQNSTMTLMNRVQETELSRREAASQLEKERNVSTTLKLRVSWQQEKICELEKTVQDSKLEAAQLKQQVNWLTQEMKRLYSEKSHDHHHVSRVDGNATSKKYTLNGNADDTNSSQPADFRTLKLNHANTQGHLPNDDDSSSKQPVDFRTLKLKHARKQGRKASVQEHNSSSIKWYVLLALETIGE